jgi:3-dehydroquinate dehydratase-2
MKILVINGPNLNMLGVREPEIYGEMTLENINSELCEFAKTIGDIELDFYQSNHEGDIVDKIQSAHGTHDGIIINPAGYTHTSVAIADAIKGVNVKTVEVHLSAIEKREEFRQISYVSKYAQKTITGKGIDGYLEALDYFKEQIK